MLRLLRNVLMIPVSLSAPQAVEAAKRFCDAQGWPWRTPIRVTLGLRKYRVVTNADAVGGNIFLDVDCSTGDASGHGPSPR